MHAQVPKDFVLSVAEQRDKLNETYRNYRSFALARYRGMRGLFVPEFCFEPGRVGMQEDAQYVDHFVGTAQDYDLG